MSATLSLKSYVDFYALQSVWYLFVKLGYFHVGNQYDDVLPDGEDAENYDVRRRAIVARFSHLNNTLVSNMAYVLRNYIWFSSLGEARHGHEYCESMPSDFPEGENRSGMAIEGISHSPELEENLATVENIFRQDWSASAYGGDAWFQIVNTIRYYSTYPVVFIDRCADLQHNTGTVFNKDTAARYAGLENECKDFHHFLDWKRDNDVLRDVLASEYAEYMSPEVFELVKDVLWVFCGEVAMSDYSPCGDFPFHVKQVEFGQEEWSSDMDYWEDSERTTCDNCGDYISDGEEYTHGWHTYCYDCYSEMFTDCEDCGSTVPTEDTYCVNDKCVCESCYEDYTECEDCGCYVNNNDITETADGYSLCSDCFSTDAHECEYGCTDDDEVIYVFKPTFFEHSEKAYTFCCDECKARYQAEHGYYSEQMALPNFDKVPYQC